MCLCRRVFHTLRVLLVALLSLTGLLAIVPGGEAIEVGWS